MNQSTLENDDQKTVMKPVAFSPLAAGLSMVGITTGYIFGPLIIIGGIGWYISKALDNKLYLFVAVVIAFAVANVLIFKTAPKVLNRMALVKKRKS